MHTHWACVAVSCCTGRSSRLSWHWKVCKWGSYVLLSPPSPTNQLTKPQTPRPWPTRKKEKKAQKNTVVSDFHQTMRRLLADPVKGGGGGWGAEGAWIHLHLLFTHNMFSFSSFCSVSCLSSSISLSLCLSFTAGALGFGWEPAPLWGQVLESSSQANQMQLLAFNVDNSSFSPTKVCRLPEMGYALNKCLLALCIYGCPVKYTAACSIPLLRIWGSKHLFLLELLCNRS